MRTSPSAKGVDAKLCQVDDPPLVEGQLSALERLRRINSDPQHRQNPPWKDWAMLSLIRIRGEKGQEMQAISVGHSVRACQSTLSVPQSALHCQSSTAHSTQTRHSNILLSILNCTELHCHRQTIVVPSSSISPYLFWPPIKTQFSHLLYMHVNGHALIFSVHMTIHFKLPVRDSFPHLFHMHMNGHPLLGDPRHVLWAADVDFRDSIGGVFVEHHRDLTCDLTSTHVLLVRTLGGEQVKFKRKDKTLTSKIMFLQFSFLNHP